MAEQPTKLNTAKVNATWAMALMPILKTYYDDDKISKVVLGKSKYLTIRDYYGVVEEKLKDYKEFKDSVDFGSSAQAEVLDKSSMKHNETITKFNKDGVGLLTSGTDKKRQETMGSLNTQVNFHGYISIDMETKLTALSVYKYAKERLNHYLEGKLIVLPIGGSDAHIIVFTKDSSESQVMNVDLFNIANWKENKVTLMKTFITVIGDGKTLKEILFAGTAGYFDFDSVENDKDKDKDIKTKLEQIKPTRDKDKWAEFKLYLMPLYGALQHTDTKGVKIYQSDNKLEKFNEVFEKDTEDEILKVLNSSVNPEMQEGGRKSRKQRKPRKSRKSRKSRKQRKSRKSRKH